MGSSLYSNKGPKPQFSNFFLLLELCKPPFILVSLRLPHYIPSLSPLSVFSPFESPWESPCISELMEMTMLKESHTSPYFPSEQWKGLLWWSFSQTKAIFETFSLINATFKHIPNLRSFGFFYLFGCGAHPPLMPLSPLPLSSLSLPLSSLSLLSPALS